MTYDVRRKPNFVGGAQIGGVDIPLPSDFAAVNMLSGWNAAKILNLARVDSGIHIVDGCAVTPSATTGKLDMASGHSFFAPNDLNVSASAAFGSTVATLLSNAGATAGQSMWVTIEQDSSGNPQQNPGAASALAPQIPDPTTGRAVLGYLWIPYGATIIDTALGTDNGNAKFYDGRISRASRVRNVVVDQSMTTYTAGTATNWLTNGTTLTQMGPTAPGPANSMRAGDNWSFSIGLRYVNNVSASTIRFLLGMGATAVVFDHTTTSITTNATGRSIEIVGDIACTGVVLKNISTRATIITRAPVTLGSATTGAESVGLVNHFTEAGANQVDLVFSVQLGTASSGATMAVEHFIVRKFPASA